MTKDRLDTFDFAADTRLLAVNRTLAMPFDIARWPLLTSARQVGATASHLAAAERSVSRVAHYTLCMRDEEDMHSVGRRLLLSAAFFCAVARAL
jgi:hypothetical protein